MNTEICGSTGIMGLLRNGEFLRIVRFLFIGGLATLVDLAVTVLMFQAVGADGLGCFLLSAARFFGGNPSADAVTAGAERYFGETVSVIAFCTAFGVSFFGHSRVTFRKKGSFDVFVKLIVLSVFNLFLRALIIALMKNYLGLFGYVPVISAMVIVTVISYAGSKYWVFRKAEDIGKTLSLTGLKP